MASKEGTHPEVEKDLAEPKPPTGESQGIGEERTRSETDSDLVEPEPSASQSRDTIGEAAALEIAAQALKAYDPLPSDSQPTVELKGDRYIVTYPHELSPGARGSSFHVKVHIDARTGKVLGLQGGA
jgi:hypothetical protein